MISTISLIAGLLGVIFLLSAPVGVIISPSAIAVISVGAVIFGLIGLHKEKKKIAVAGIVLGIVGMGIFFIFKTLAAARDKVMVNTVSMNSTRTNQERNDSL